MKFEKLSIEGAWIGEAQIIQDSRGNFREWFKRKELLAISGINFQATQGNISVSRLNTLRGIHYSLAKEGQAKWVTCTQGSILDFLVDLRTDSLTFLKTEQIQLSSTNGLGIYIPSGVAHGFLAQEEGSQVNYLLTSDFNPKCEFEVNFFDEEIGLKIGIHESLCLLSNKDARAPKLRDLLQSNMLPQMSSV